MSGHRILVVEDAPDLALAISMELEEIGHVVTVAHSGAEARDEIAREAPELAVLDMQLPDTTGTALCQEIRKSLSIPVIIFSGVNAATSVREVIRSGATDYVLKGSGLAELVGRVKQHLGPGAATSEPLKKMLPPTRQVAKTGLVKVLVVESDKAAEARLVELLTSANCSVTTASTSAEALELFRVESPAVVVVELDSRQTGGLKLVQAIRTLEGIRTPGVIGISKRLAPEAVRRAKYHGVAAFITRPWNASRIHLEIAQAIAAALKAAKRVA